MKSVLLILGTVIILLSISGCPSSEVPADLYSIGDIGPAGGFIFYVDSADTYPGWKYLEAAPINWEGDSNDRDPIFPWGGYGVECFVSATSIGTGEANTLALIGHNHATPHTAALQVYYADGISGARREIGGFSDWFLPSKDELQAMHDNLFNQTPSHGGFISGTSYWSSSEFDTIEAEYVIFGMGIIQSGYNRKDNEDGISVRPARSF